MFFGTGLAKASAPGAALIQFVGGIHEIYFPYVLMKPIMILAAIGGGMTGIFTLVVTGAGLRSPAAPGSIIAVYAADRPRQLRRRDTLRAARHDRVLPDRLGDPEGQQDPGGSDRGRSPRRRHLPDGGNEGQEELGVLPAHGCRRRLPAASPSSPGRSRTSSSRATPAWAPARWAPRCCGTRSRLPASRTSRSPTRRSPTSATPTTSSSRTRT